MVRFQRTLKASIDEIGHNFFRLDYPGSVRWQHILSPVDLCSADVTTRAVLPQHMVDTLFGSQVNYEIKTRQACSFITREKDRRPCYDAHV